MQTHDRLINTVHVSILCVTDQTEALSIQVVCTHTLLAKVQGKERDPRPISTNSYHEQLLGEELRGPAFMPQRCALSSTLRAWTGPGQEPSPCWSPGRWPD